MFIWGNYLDLHVNKHALDKEKSFCFPLPRGSNIELKFSVRKTILASMSGIITAFRQVVTMRK